ncbi:MAG: 1-deoxy-D-xylulose-5-phosphate reductoisomerase [Rickettsiales bacterium]|nr:1-deoxy-D-xylulose-5-phosphate reductoisomerase [Rickettsiales bacterium]
MKKKITIFGSTGSIGHSTLDIISDHLDMFEVIGLTINCNYEKLNDQVKKFSPKVVSINNNDAYKNFLKINKDKNLKILNGNDSLINILDFETDMIVAGITGAVGLMPVIRATEMGKIIALANKENLVCSGSLITKLAKKSGSLILPIDSEHNAIHQVLDESNRSKVSKLILTASGGPFLRKSALEMKDITPDEAIKHPNWSMGRKISVDSATMMNKGLELIEAHFLFDFPHEKIDVVIHPESIIHSCVEYSDGSILSQMGNPDMRTPIAYALAYPNRIETKVKKLKLSSIQKLTFFEPDLIKFPCLELAYESLKIKKSAPTILNAANEIAVEAFLNEQIKFLSISKVVEKTLNRASISPINSIKDVLDIDNESRLISTELINQVHY